MSATIKTFGPVRDDVMQQMENCTREHAIAGVLCADNHLGYSQPIGAAIAYPEHLSVSGVGYDIGCGNLAVRTDLRADTLDQEFETGVWGIMDQIREEIPFGMGRGSKAVKRRSYVDHPIIDRIADADFVPQRAMRELAADQLGSVGGGNHYVDIFEDEAGLVWIGVHFGSRGFGHKTASGFMSIAKGGKFTERPKGDTMMADPLLLHQDSEEGQAYGAAMQLAQDYAAAGREVVVNDVLRILGRPLVTFVAHNHHNALWREPVSGEDCWVVRKGCTPSAPGQFGFVGSSMGEQSVILQGRDTDENRDALYSTVHGAGRVMSRTEAAGKFKWRKREDGTRYREQVRKGVVNWDAVRADLEDRGIVLRGGEADEAPEAYKRLDEVLAYHRGSVDVVHRLTPLGVAMAGSDDPDPYKD